MQVQYIFNSCFVIELDTHILLFDYYRTKLPKFNPDKPLYVFVSHKHHDHYNPDIYNIDHPHITYILSDDVDAKGIKIGANKSCKVDDIEIQTLLSTDLGVAFIIYVEDKYIYHAGDLHWWHWIGEANQDNQFQKEVFQQEINKIKDIPFTIMMTPLDPRLKEATPWGMDYILQNVNTKYVLPMHFFTKLKGMQEYLQQPPLSKYSNIITIHNRGEKFTLE
ncbi:MAG: MBL fold metallo-hydrolase [Coprobacillaceae bacterium]